MTRPLLLLLLLAGACEKNDVGKPCGTESSDLPPEPVTGEDPVPEVVRMERDGVCESFMCLRHAGLEPYCTRTCDDVTPKKAKGCTVTSDCEDPDHCLDGRCVDDDCPEGFWCRVAQEVGPLGGERFCVRQEGCTKNTQCENLSDIRCDRYGCFDACLLAGQACSAETPCPQGTRCDVAQSQCVCEYSQLLCLAESDLPCSCPGGGLACEDIELCCSSNGGACWREGSVSRTGFCYHKEPPG